MSRAAPDAAVDPPTMRVTSREGQQPTLAVAPNVIVTAARQPDGSLVAQRIGVGKDGLVPPM